MENIVVKVEDLVKEHSDQIHDVVEKKADEILDKVEDNVESVLEKIGDKIDEIIPDEVKKVLDTILVDGRVFSCSLFGFLWSLRITRKLRHSPLPKVMDYTNKSVVEPVQNVQQVETPQPKIEILIQ
jgi:hypothetical protein